MIRTEQGGNALALDVLHRHEIGFAHLAQLDDLGHVGVRDPRDQSCLVDEHLDEVLVLSQVLVDQLDRHQPLEPVRAGESANVDVGHAARRKTVEQGVTTELSPTGFRLHRG